MSCGSSVYEDGNERRLWGDAELRKQQQTNQKESNSTQERSVRCCATPEKRNGVCGCCLILQTMKLGALYPLCLVFLPQSCGRNSSEVKYALSIQKFNHPTLLNLCCQSVLCARRRIRHSARKKAVSSVLDSFLERGLYICGLYI